MALLALLSRRGGATVNGRYTLDMRSFHCGSHVSPLSLSLFDSRRNCVALLQQQQLKQRFMYSYYSRSNSTSSHQYEHRNRDAARGNHYGKRQGRDGPLTFKREERTFDNSRNFREERPFDSGGRGGRFKKRPSYRGDKFKKGGYVAQEVEFFSDDEFEAQIAEGGQESNDNATAADNANQNQVEEDLAPLGDIEVAKTENIDVTTIPRYFVTSGKQPRKNSPWWLMRAKFSLPRTPKDAYAKDMIWTPGTSLWNELKVPSHIFSALHNAGVHFPSEVQKRAIPLMLTFPKKDVIIHSAAGSGKTFAYLLPILAGVKANVNNCQTLILTPTRELAVQNSLSVRHFEKCIDDLRMEKFAGEWTQMDLHRLKEHPPHIMSATVQSFARLPEEVFMSIINSVNTIVFEETDMLVGPHTSSFVNMIADAAADRKSKPRFIAVTSTITPATEEFTEKYFSNGGELISVFPLESKNTKFAMPSHVRHELIPIPNKVSGDEKNLEKFTKFVNYYQRNKPSRVLIFFDSIEELQYVGTLLTSTNIPVFSVSSADNKLRRAKAFKKFEKVKGCVLLSTEMLARGIDLPHISHVVNWNLPEDIVSYVHRSGRVGRLPKLSAMKKSSEKYPSLRSPTQQITFKWMSFMSQLAPNGVVASFVDSESSLPNDLSKAAKIHFFPVHFYENRWRQQGASGDLTTQAYDYDRDEFADEDYEDYDGDDDHHDQDEDDDEFSTSDSDTSESGSDQDRDKEESRSEEDAFDDEKFSKQFREKYLKK